MPTATEQLEEIYKTIRNGLMNCGYIQMVETGGGGGDGHVMNFLKENAIFCCFTKGRTGELYLQNRIVQDAQYFRQHRNRL